MLIRELNSKLRLGLDPSQNLNPEVVGGGSVSKREQFLVVGVSSANQCADALERSVCHVIKTIIPGWSCVKSKIPSMEDLLRKKLTEATKACTVVLQFLDSAFYFTRTEEGGLLPSKRGEDGRYHVEGDSVFALMELHVYSIFNQAKPLLVLAGDLMKILISPLPRYLKERCCGNKKHVPNLEDNDYGTNLEDTVLASRPADQQNLKDFAFWQGFRYIRVLGPWSSLRQMGSTVWEVDQVHMSRVGFDAMAELVVTCA